MNKCKDCKHWSGPSSWNLGHVPGVVETTGDGRPVTPRPLGLCSEVGVRGFRIMMFDWSPDDGGGPRLELETHEDFGCAKWSAKGA